MNLLALVDCDNFYASCERVFRPDLKKIPIVVLSNNDGCVIARSKEAKSMGIGMGVPWFKIKRAYLAQGGRVFSSNFALYGDLSNRVMHVLSGMSQSMEIYSIDEAFLGLHHLQDPRDAYAFGIHCRSTVHQWVGVPVRIGIAPTKTLAKVASHIAKKRNGGTGVACLHTAGQIKRALRDIPAHEVWGVGRQLSSQLNELGVISAFDLSEVDISLIRKKFSVVLERTVRELRGEPCLEIQEKNAPKKQIIVSRSFKTRINNQEELKPLISNFAARAAEKLRNEKQKCSKVSVLIATSPFEKTSQYRGFASFQFSTPTNDTRSILLGATKALNDSFKGNYIYAKAGVLLSSFSCQEVEQQSLFQDMRDGLLLQPSAELMQCIDLLNQEQQQIYFASQHPESFARVQTKMMSPRYTTNWHELPTAS